MESIVAPLLTLDSFMGIATLEKDKLIELINDLVAANPHLQSEIDAHLPSPTTRSVSQLISHLEFKLNDSYPLHRSGKGQDDYSFVRVKPCLMEVVVIMEE
jgi:hypothetical protein